MRYLFRYYYLGFSFSLIGVYLSGSVDAWFSVLMRIGIATMILPFKAEGSRTPDLTAIGAVQLGLMYCFYFQSFRFLTARSVAFSVFNQFTLRC
jgi:hypothetical protein